MIRHENLISENNIYAGMPTFVGVTAAEEHGPDLPGSQGKTGNRMCNIVIHAREEKANQLLTGN